MRRREMLLGLAAVGTAVAAAPSWAAADPVRQTVPLDKLLTAGGPNTAPMPPAQLATRLSTARQAFQQCRYRQLMAGLPDLIAAAIASRDRADGGAREHFEELLSQCYRLGSELCVKLSEDSIAWVLADRALTAAHHSGDAVSIVESTRRVAVAMRRGGHHDGALDLLTNVGRSIDPYAHGRPGAAVAAYGAMLYTAAYSSAQHGNSGHAIELIDEAHEVAGRLHRTGPVGSPFGITNVTIYRIAVCTSVGDTAGALRHADRIDLQQLSTPERRGRYFIDTARACVRHGSYDRAYQAVLAAEHHAPQEVRRPSVRELVYHLLHVPAHGPAPGGLRELAGRIGVVRR